ncbi:MAG: FHA domain-containing protein [Bacteroidales bacterium]|nr:FHA domain-containing protein [Bacteroidales bacterium]
MKGLFYILRWKGGDFRNDEQLAASENIVRIGQRADCDVRLPNGGPFADELFAVIKPAKSPDCWQLIPVSEFVHTYVNGSSVGLNHYLRNGDRISFSETGADILFELRKGENPGTAHFTSVSRRFVTAVSIAAVLAVVLAFYGIIAPSLQKTRNSRLLATADQSVVRITVDSVFYVRTVSGQDCVLEGEASAGQRGLVMNGTAFLTTDGLLVTARHCIEPWLNYNLVFSSKMSLDELPLCTAWALKAETYNQTHDNDTSYSVISKCTLYGVNGYLGTYLSSDFRCNCERDEIVEIGDFSNRYFIRSITGRFNRSDMMLGDLAVMKLLSLKGTITLPSEELLEKEVVAGSALTFKGYPRRQETGIETSPGDVLKDFAAGHMISHNGGLEPGYSGGPALFVCDGKVYAAGVISTFDKDSRHCIYSVPASEIINIPAL